LQNIFNLIILYQATKEFGEPGLALEGDAFHYDHREDDDYYTQPGDLFRLMTPEQKQVLFTNTANQVGGAERFIQERHIGNCYKADPDYGAGVAMALGINLTDIMM